VRSAREAAGEVRRVVELAVAKMIDLAVGVRREAPAKVARVADPRVADPEPPVDSTAKTRHDCWGGARTVVENVFRYHAGQESHFAACVVFTLQDDGKMVAESIVSRHLLEKKPARGEEDKLQRDMLEILREFVWRQQEKRP
jgi:hypothetical protein